MNLAVEGDFDAPIAEVSSGSMRQSRCENSLLSVVRFFIRSCCNSRMVFAFVSQLLICLLFAHDSIPPCFSSFFPKLQLRVASFVF